MEGILLVDKPINFSSHQVVNYVRRILNIRKIGHAGTLDPLASGLLLLLIGKATKLSNQLIQQNKTYLVESKLFEATTTGDLGGAITRQDPVQKFTFTQLEDIINSFNNYSYQQTPPIFSAIKVKGLKLYQYALAGRPVDIPKKLVTINSIQLLTYESTKNTIRFEVNCSKGTYIRSLVLDIADRLNTTAVVVTLRRISSGNFHIREAIELQKLNLENIKKNLKTI